MILRASLPDLNTLTPEALKALIVAQHEQILSKDEQLASRDEEIERLKLLIAKLRRMQFGRKSDKLDWQIEQLELKNWRCAGRSRPLFPRSPRLAGRINKFVVSRLLPCNPSPILSEDQALPPWPVSVDDHRRSESAAF